MGVPRTLDELLLDLARRIKSVERRIVLLRPSAALTRGTTAQRDDVFGVPSTTAERVALANEMPVWFNTEKGWEERYYAVAGSAGLTVPGLYNTFTAGWYNAPAATMGGKSGPQSFVSSYIAAWARGWINAGSALDATGSANGVRIGLTGLYSVQSLIRADANGGAQYHALSLNGDRTAFENRSFNAPMVGLWTHDHGVGTNTFSESHYLGTLYAGDFISAGPSSASPTMALGAAASNGMLSIHRLA